MQIEKLFVQLKQKHEFCINCPGRDFTFKSHLINICIEIVICVIDFLFFPP